jgi:RNA 2',3'-cyclic 3'-phosphodiesterase
MSPSSTARLFAAIDPPSIVREQLSAWAREVSGAIRGHSDAAGDQGPGAAKLRLLAPEIMHITLCFLGSRPVAEMEMLAAALDTCAGRAGELSLGAPLWLPPRGPRSLALEIHDGPDGWLGELQQRLSHAFARAVDWQPERRRFRAHVTVARIGRGGKPSRRVGRGRRARTGREASGEPHEQALPPPLPPTPQLTFTPVEVVLYRSWLDPQGASYEAIATRTLSASASPSSSSSPCGDAGAGPPEP